VELLYGRVGAQRHPRLSRPLAPDPFQPARHAGQARRSLRPIHDLRAGRPSPGRRRGLNIEGRIAEGPGENFFVVKNGAIKTNDISESVLEGITRTSVLEIARDFGIKTAIEPITVEDLVTADEAFFTGTAVEVIPINRLVDGSDRNAPRRESVIGTGKPGPVTLRLRKAYLDIVRGANPKYDKWLTPVR
jgi:branched-chain amino acid aminotransferase